MLPEKVKLGVTWRRFKNGLKKPLTTVQNLTFWLRDSISKEKHIFVVGPPRSGTTLVKNVLRAHSAVCSIDDETFFFFRRNYTAFRHPEVEEEEMRSLIQKARTSVEPFDSFADHVKQGHGSSIFLEKTPEHALRIAYLVRHFPKSKIVFVARDPRDGFRSAKQNPAYWNSLPKEDPLRAYAETWKQSVRKAWEYKKSDHLYFTTYERFCTNPEKELQSCNSFLEIETEQDRQLNPKIYSRTKVKNQKGVDSELVESLKRKGVLLQ